VYLIQFLKQSWFLFVRSFVFIDDVAENDLVMKSVSHVFLDTLGEQTAKIILLMDQLIKSKFDLLQQISKWIWRYRLTFLIFFDTSLSLVLCKRTHTHTYTRDSLC
jgi:hypothetical protein